MILNSQLKQIDHVLKILKNHQSVLNYQQIKDKVDTSNIVIEPSVLKMILEKLVRDNYVYVDPALAGGYYNISFEGNLFVGYEKQVKIDHALDVRHNVRDFVLSWGTVLAGIAASALLAWQIYSYFHPVPCV